MTLHHLPTLLLLVLSLPSLIRAQSIVQVLGASPKQSIDGFGCSVAFMGQAIQTLPSTPRAAILNLLFSPSTGAGFSIARTRISPYLSPSPGVYNYTADAEEVGTRYVVTQAKALGATRFLASAWTPPSRFKTNQDPIGGSIDSSASSFSGYAAYLSKYVTTYNQTYGIQWYAISPQNEPEVQTDYESCSWQDTDFVQFLGTYLGPRFQQDHVSSLVLAPESSQWFEGTIAATLSNVTSRPGVQIVGAHPYFAGEYNADGGIGTSGYDYFALSKAYNKQLWATEFSNLSSNADNILESVRVATLVHKQLTVPESNAFIFWWGATNKPETNGGITESLISFNASGSYVVRKRLWALGQFARFIRPGWARVDATAEPVQGVHVTAFKGGTQVAIVAINEGLAAASVKFNLYNIQASTMAGYRTSSTESLKSIGNFGVSAGSFTVSLAAQSVTTFIGTTNSSAAAFAGSPAFITEFNNLAGSSGASGDLLTKFQIGTIDPSNSGSDETALLRQTNTAEWVQYPISTTFKSFVLSVQRNANVDGLSFAAVSTSGALTTLTATKSKETTQPGAWFVYTYTITSVPAGTKHIRILFSATNAEWNPRLTRLVIA